MFTVSLIDSIISFFSVTFLHFFAFYILFLYFIFYSVISCCFSYSVFYASYLKITEKANKFHSFIHSVCLLRDALAHAGTVQVVQLGWRKNVSMINFAVMRVTPSHRDSRYAHAGALHPLRPLALPVPPRTELCRK